MKRIIVALILSAFFCAFSNAVTITEFEKYKGKDYGPEYFFAIEGDISGKAAPGVEAVYVNNKPIQVDVDLSFSTKVALKKGEKYLTIETRYKGLHFIKKYLVIRHPQVKEPLKIHVPREEFEEIIKKEPQPFLQPKKEKKAAPEKKKTIAKKTKPKSKAKPKVASKSKPKPTPAPKPMPKEEWLGFEIVRELRPGMIFVVREVAGKYFGSIYISSKKIWIPLGKISHLELKALLEEGELPKICITKQ